MNHIPLYIDEPLDNVGQLLVVPKGHKPNANVAKFIKNVQNLIGDPEKGFKYTEPTASKLEPPLFKFSYKV